MSTFALGRTAVHPKPEEVRRALKNVNQVLKTEKDLHDSKLLHNFAQFFGRFRKAITEDIERITIDKNKSSTRAI